MTDQQIEQEIQAKGLTAPRITARSPRAFLRPSPAPLSRVGARIPPNSTLGPKPCAPASRRCAGLMACI